MYEPYQPVQSEYVEQFQTLEAFYAGLPIQTLFIGDSRVSFPPDQALQIGPDPAVLRVPGEHVENVLWRALNSALDFSGVTRAVIMAGTNNLLQTHDTPVDIAYGVQQIVAAVHQRAPLAQIRTFDIYEAWFPYVTPWTEARRVELNRRLNNRASASGLFRHVTLAPMNVNDPLIYVTRPGRELLHLTPTGYLPVTAAISAAL